jgi:hypothetical protein
MRIYTQQALEEAPWPNTPDGAYARRVLPALIGGGTRAFIGNVQAEVRVLAAGGHVLPLVLADDVAPLKNAYVCSPTTHYIDYAQREVQLELADRPLLRALLPPLLEALRPLMRFSRVERCAYVNNWLLSTNLHPALDGAALKAIRDGLVSAFPRHTLVFRSLNAALNGPLIAELERLGFQRVFSRQVYLLDPRDGSFRRRNNYGHDRRLARRSAYNWIEAPALPPAAAGRLCELYNDLYLHKYSQHNPQFTPLYFEQALREQWATCAALAQGSRIDGVLGFIEHHNVVTAPIVGYDRARDQGAGLYRLLMLRLIDSAAERGRILHMSSGAAGFKRLRGAEPQIEYSLVYHRHLGPRRRLPWQLLAALSEGAIIPLMRRYGL